MDLNKLKTRIAEVLGVSESEKELAFDIFVNNVFQVLEPEETLKVPKIGFLQYKTQPIDTGDVIITDQTANGQNNLIYAPLSDDLSSDSNPKFLIINISREKKDLHKLDENVFSIGVGKPILPISEQYNGDDTETYYVLLKKSIEERVGELISESEHLKNFDVWGDYVSMNIFDSSDTLETESLSKYNLTEEFEYFEEEITSGTTEKDLMPDEDDSLEKSPGTDIPEPEIPENDLMSVEDDSLEKSPGTDIPEPEIPENDLMSAEDDSLEKSPGTDIPEPEIPENDLMPAEDDSLEKSPGADIPEPEIPENDFESSQKFYESFSDDVDSGQEETDNPELDTIDELEKESHILQPDSLEEKEFSGLDEFKKTSDKDISESEDENIDWELEEDLSVDSEDKTAAIEKLEPVEEPVIKEAKETTKFLKKDNTQRSKNTESGAFQSGINTGNSSYANVAEHEYADDEKFNASFITKFILIIVSFAALIAIVFLVIIPWANDQLIEEPPQGQEVQFSEMVSTPSADVENDSPVISETDTENDVQSESKTTEVIDDDNQIEEETRLIEEPDVSASTTQNDLYRNIPNESPVRGLIFTDGSKYFVQVSSWRNTETAESEVKRLRNLGYDAFIVEAYIPKFKSTWYRVKIGDFNSITEAERFQQNKKF